jgi:hypothetical protein
VPKKQDDVLNKHSKDQQLLSSLSIKMDNLTINQKNKLISVTPQQQVN